MNTEQARFNMIEQQIRPWQVLDTGVLELLSKIRREEFVLPAHRALAFADLELPLTADTEQAQASGQVMLAPKVQARLLQDAAIQPSDKVLEIGTGSGYLTALLASQAERVISLEIDPTLATLARANLQRAGITNAEVRQADGAAGLVAEGPFDVIVLGGSVAEIPHRLLTQLQPGGRLVAIVGDEPVMRASVVTRVSGQDYRTTQGWDTVAPRLKNFSEHTHFNF